MKLPERYKEVEIYERESGKFVAPGIIDKQGIDNALTMLHNAGILIYTREECIFLYDLYVNGVLIDYKKLFGE